MSTLGITAAYGPAVQTSIKVIEASYHCSQVINESANFCRDCPSYLASAETVRDLLLPVETTGHKKWLPAETVCEITRTVSAGIYLPRTVSAGSKRSRTVSAEAKYDGQSLQEA